VEIAVLSLAEQSGAHDEHHAQRHLRADQITERAFRSGGPSEEAAKALE
jgi:hypothetical protein